MCTKIQYKQKHVKNSEKEESKNGVKVPKTAITAVFTLPSLSTPAVWPDATRTLSG